MLNYIPVIGWALSFVGSVFLAVPFWFLWTVCGLGAHYFAFLPSQFHSVPFWNCVGLFMVASILKVVLVPRLATVSQNHGERKESA